MKKGNTKSTEILLTLHPRFKKYLFDKENPKHGITSDFTLATLPFKCSLP